MLSMWQLDEVGGFEGCFVEGFGAVEEDFVHVVFGPLDELVDDWEEGAGALGETVFNAWRNLGKYLTLDKTVGFEGAEGEHKHLL